MLRVKGARCLLCVFSKRTYNKKDVLNLKTGGSLFIWFFKYERYWTQTRRVQNSAKGAQLKHSVPEIEKFPNKESFNCWYLDITKNYIDYICISTKFNYTINIAIASHLCQVTEFTNPKASSSSQCWGWNKQSWHRRPSSSYHPKRYSTMQTSWPKRNFRVQVFKFIIESYERFSTLALEKPMACWGMSMTSSLMTITVWKWYLSHWKLWFSTWDSCCNHGQQLWQLNLPPLFARGNTLRGGRLTSHEQKKAKHRPTSLEIHLNGSDVILFGLQTSFLCSRNASCINSLGCWSSST